MMDQLQGRLEGWLVYDLAECKESDGARSDQNRAKPKGSFKQHVTPAGIS